MNLRPIALLLALSACKEEHAALPSPVEMTADSVGYFCQMNVLEHGGPKGQIALDGMTGTPLFFSQVTDTVAYLQMPEQNYKILATYVSDMGAAPSWDHPGTKNWVLIDNAVFVVGSDLTGGMGRPEFVPFSDPTKAVEFVEAHGGHIEPFSELPTQLPLWVDDTTGAVDDSGYSARLRALTLKSGD
ncbi:MAG: nitrous oxide reductase accessory protein NosL [Paracoccaceae bacterium]